MSEDRSLPYGSPLPASWLSAIQEFIGTAGVNFHLSLANSTTVQVIAGGDSGQVGLGIGGLFRYISATISAAVTGAAGAYDIFAVTGPNNFVANPGQTPPETDQTNYDFALQVLAVGTTPTPTATVTSWRKIGELQWDGSKITQLRSLVGEFDARQPLTPTAPAPAVSPVRAIGAASQTAPLQTWETSGGTTVGSVDNAGVLSLTGGISGASLGVTGAVGGQSLSISGSGSVGGTLTVGALTITGTGDSRMAQPGDLICSVATSRAGCLLCDGGIYNQSQYPALYAAIGTKFGTGDGTSGSFNVPNYLDRSIVGASSSRTLGSTGGASTVTLSGVNLPPHAHHYDTSTDMASADGLGRHAPVQDSSADPIWAGALGSAGGGNVVPYLSSGWVADSGMSHSHHFSGDTQNGPGTSTPIGIYHPYGTANIFVKF